MAIQIDLATSKFGVPFNGVYFRIVRATIERTRNIDPKFTVVMQVSGYAAVLQNNDTAEVDFRQYYAPMNDIEAMAGEDFLSKCYAWVMTQADMVGSTAV
jgi:hypothetical protein